MAPPLGVEPRWSGRYVGLWTKVAVRVEPKLLRRPPIKIHGLFPRARLELAPPVKSTLQVASGAYRYTTGDVAYIKKGTYIGFGYRGYRRR